MASRGISLTREEQQKVFVKGRGDAFRLRIRAHDAVLMPTKIFAHERRLIDPHTGNTADDFAFICSPFDCAIYPASEPDPTQSPQFFRKAVVDFLVPSEEMAMEAWEDIHEQVCRLVTAFNNLDILIEVETVRCGDDLDEEEEEEPDEETPEESVSESTSESESL